MAERERRQAARRQAGSQDEGRSGRERVDVEGRVQGVLDVVRAHPKLTFFVLALVLVVGMLYGPTRDYYVAARTNQDLMARYQALAQQNGLLEDDIDRLLSEEGIEDEAHRRGYVKEGETGVVVEGLVDEDLTALLGEVQVEDTRPWYIRVLDVVFYYSEDSWQ